MDDFLAFDRSFRGGVFVSTGWIKGFAFPDVIVGAALVGAAGIWMLFTRFRPSARTTALPA